MFLLKICVLLFSLIVLAQVYASFKERKLNLFWFLFWVTVWSAADLAVLFPDLTNILAAFFDIKYGINAVLFFSVITLFYLTFRLYLKIEEQKEKLSQLVRREALKENRQNIT